LGNGIKARFQAGLQIVTIFATGMRTKIYRAHSVELDSEEIRSGEWFARATIVIEENRKTKRIPIFGRRRATFETQRQADTYALELAKMWIDGRTWGTNGHG
jgi:hypothetical protein